MKKKYIISLIIALSFINLNAQDKLVPPHISFLDNSSIIQRDQNKFLLGWNWGSPGRDLDNALMMNAYHDLSIYTTA